MVMSDPDLCDAEKYPRGAISVVFDMQAEIVHSAATTVYGFGTMAAMLIRHKLQEPS
jgi:hypothetical protein